MKQKSIIKSILICTILSGMILSACSPAAAPAPTAVPVSPTEDIAVIQTHAVETVLAAITETALSQPTATETPVPATATPMEGIFSTNTPINTFTSVPSNTVAAVVQSGGSGGVAPTWTVAVTSTPESTEWRCAILSSLIADGTVMFPGETFSAGWTVENRGTGYWSAAGIDVVYYYGTKMQKEGSRVDIPNDVPPTGNTAFSITMLAPSNPGTYSATWILSGDPGTFCPMTVTIKVE